jgi:hypothetical protein
MRLGALLLLIVWALSRYFQPSARGGGGVEEHGGGVCFAGSAPGGGGVRGHPLVGVLLLFGV